ncbi:hypothetical protein CRG98_003117 [Punica granatum]|uniref:Uncharacterized protein n=1 Tax=Punica granatum TaxID=22663 RepID=A0A2I0L721_PUNGR|nr:hypothetical protein CRG98_003117 [Punica granatum]
MEPPPCVISSLSLSLFSKRGEITSDSGSSLAATLADEDAGKHEARRRFRQTSGCLLLVISFPPFSLSWMWLSDLALVELEGSRSNSSPLRRLGSLGSLFSKPQAPEPWSNEPRAPEPLGRVRDPGVNPATRFGSPKHDC